MHGTKNIKNMNKPNAYDHTFRKRKRENTFIRRKSCDFLSHFFFQMIARATGVKKGLEKSYMKSITQINYPIKFPYANFLAMTLSQL